MDTSKYKKLYLQEASGRLSGIESALLALEKDPEGGGAPSIIDNLFRHYHTIKGMSASMGYDVIARLAHAQEDLLDGLRSKAIPFSGEMAETLLEGLDILKNLVGLVQDDQAPEGDIEPFITKLKGLRGLRGLKGAGPPPPEPGALPPTPATPATPGPPGPEPQARQGRAPSTGPPRLRLRSIMKVESSVFDELLTFVGDLFMELSSMRALSQMLRSIDLKDAIHMLGKTVNSLHTSTLTARMLPIGDLTEGLPRVIRDITSKTGKSVSLKIEGAEISLDRAILEDLGGPLVHIIRNAVDHGIEDPSTREKAGKDPAGAIKIKAYARKDRVVLEVSDDGRGIDIEKVKVKAVADGVSMERIRRMSPQEILMLVCIPALSTSTGVSDTSGRGVGMDVVKKAVEALGGSLTLESIAGKSTTVIMELPRTTSIIKVLFVDVADEIVMLPLSQILKVVEVERESVSGGVFRSDDGELPVIPLGAALGIDHDGSRQTCTIVVAEESGSRVWEGGTGRPGCNRLVAIQVDDFGEETDAYIKPLMPPISRLPGVSGITVTGDGRPVFLVDVAQLMSKAAPVAGVS